MRRLFCLLLASACLAAGPAAWAKDASRAVNLHPLEAQDMVQAEPRATFLVDVRTRGEYTLQGHPRNAYNIPWRFGTNDFQVEGGSFQGGRAPYTGYQVSLTPNPDFVGVAQSLFKPEDRLIVISTEGSDGAEAADALAAAGFKHVYNVRGGFLGDPLTSKELDRLAQKHSPHYGQRGRVNGWVFWGLPVSHTVDPRFCYPPDLKRMQNMQ